jgi:hypothetical protein
MFVCDRGRDPVSIVFEPYTAVSGEASVAGLLATVSGFSDQFASVQGLLASCSADGRLLTSASVRAALATVQAFNGNFSAAGGLLAAISGSSFVLPNYAVGAPSGLLASCTADGSALQHGDGSIAGLLGAALGFNGQYAAVRGLLASALSVPIPSDGAFLMVLQSPGYAYMEDPEDATHKFMVDAMRFEATSPSAQAVLALLDSIAFRGDVTQQIHLHALIAAEIAFGDVSFGAPVGILTDAVQFSDSNVALAMYLATLLDSFAVAAELTGTGAIFAFLADTFEFDASLSVQQQILQALRDGIEFGMTLYTGADTYTAWVMTPETRAMRSYSNYAFNSYAVFNGRLFGAKDDGIYVLEGDTDAGQAIDGAKVRSGLLDFGSRQLKRVERAYLGYTAAGTLALRVTTTSPQGQKIDYTYRAVQPPMAEAPRETRVLIGKGLQSVYWAFELDNSLDGADFELHDVTVLPIVLSRKVR